MKLTKDPRGIDMPASMNDSLDGSHWGLDDWYPNVEEAIRYGLEWGCPEHDWTTGWWGSKKEIASARITYSARNEKLTVEASVSDDFDTIGLGVAEIDICDDVEEMLEAIRTAISAAWDAAESNRKDNRPYRGYSIISPDGHWVETYLVNISGYDLPEPPCDNYHQWGFQEETDLPATLRDMIIGHIEEHDFDEGPAIIEDVDGDWTIKVWD